MVSTRNNSAYSPGGLECKKLKELYRNRKKKSTKKSNWKIEDLLFRLICLALYLLTFIMTISLYMGQQLTKTLNRLAICHLRCHANIYYQKQYSGQDLNLLSLKRRSVQSYSILSRKANLQNVQMRLKFSKMV